MKIDIRHSPSFAAARCYIPAGGAISVEAGAMYAQSAGVTVESKMEGGLFGAAKRAILSGDSFFVSRFNGAKDRETWVDIVPTLPGDLFSMDITSGSSLILTKGSWLASDLTVDIDSKLGNRGTFFGGEGLFVVKASGTGTVVCAAYGAIDQFSLAAGETITLDTGHLVAYEDGMQVKIRKIAKGFLNTMKSGEGLVMDITGPGDVITQTRNPSAFGSWIASVIPSSGGSSSGGGLSSLL